METRADDIRTLNGLIANVFDSADGYRTAARNAENPRYATLFSELASSRLSLATSLQDEVSALGGNPEDEGTALAAAHRGFLRLRDAVTGGSDQSVLAELDRGESYLTEKFDAALAADGLSETVRTTISTAAQRVHRDHDRIEELRTNRGEAI